MTLDGNDEWVKPERGVPLYSLVGNRLVQSESRLLYKGKSDSMVRVRTRSGRCVRVTPVHRLFTVSREGALQEKPAANLSPGDYLASIRRLPSPEKDQKIEAVLPKLQRHGKSI